MESDKSEFRIFQILDLKNSSFEDLENDGHDKES
jgi:hypothetical protein